MLLLKRQKNQSQSAARNLIFILPELISEHDFYLFITKQVEVSPIYMPQKKKKSKNFIQSDSERFFVFLSKNICREKSFLRLWKWTNELQKTMKIQWTGFRQIKKQTSFFKFVLKWFDLLEL